MKEYLVGGAVRDVYMGKTPSDRDYVVVGGSVQEMLSQGYEQVGAAFPVFLHPVTGEEYALARTERKVGEGYHGFETDIDGVTIEEDLSRRDFTINAMAIDMETGDLIDPHGGLKDLRAWTLRHVGPAFREDPLRVVRMARFLARFPGFTVADDTFFLAQQMVRNLELNELSWERFAAEIVKVLDTCTPDGCYTFFDVLDKLKCDVHVSFFAGLKLMYAARVAKAVKLKITPGVRHNVFAALVFSDDERCELVGGSLARDVKNALKLVERKKVEISDVYQFLKQTGAWKNGPTWTMALPTMQLGASLEREYGISWGQLMYAEAVTTPVGQIGAELAAEGMPGNCIGREIETLRFRALEALDL